MDFEYLINDLAFLMEVACHLNAHTEEPSDYVKPLTDVL